MPCVRHSEMHPTGSVMLAHEPEPIMRRLTDTRIAPCCSVGLSQQLQGCRATEQHIRLQCRCGPPSRQQQRFGLV